jgi:hypothetical protein
MIMATQMERANAWVAGALKRCRETGQPQQSKDWGSGQRARSVTIMAYDATTMQYTVSLLAWGHEERTITGSAMDVHTEAAGVLADAG